MSRRAIALAVLSFAAVVVIAACQDYNLNPVGSCIIQPGSTQVQLTGATTADILFVVDDSGSMDPKQQHLAENFNTFITSLANAQKSRVASGLEPFEFHIAVTTSSIFVYTGGNLITNYPSSFSGCAQGTATANAPYPAGDFVSFGSNPKVIHFTKDLTWLAWTPSTAYTVGTRVTNAGNVYSCITAGTSAASGGPTTTASDITDGTVHWQYVSADPIVTLIRDFVGTCTGVGCPATGWAGGNVEVGSCGSGQEQHLEAGRLAIQKVINGQQPGVQPGEFLHPGAKLVVVWVADEDDCSNNKSSPIDNNLCNKCTAPGPSSIGGDDPNAQCTPDATYPYPTTSCPTSTCGYYVHDYDAFFAGLGREFGAGFVVASNKCTQGGAPRPYEPADVNVFQSPASCTGTAQFACSDAFHAGFRQLQLASAFTARKFSVVEGSVCEAFGPILAAIADLVKPINKLNLPSVPASGVITVVRIVDASGKQVGNACAQGTGWWFMNCNDTNTPPAVAPSPTQCIYINHAGGTCEAQPGQSYSAEYIGMIPPGGCASPSNSFCPSDAACTQVGLACGGGSGVCRVVGKCCGKSAQCAAALGGTDADWSCYGAAAPGTCLCNPK